jgi:hypothetical protein
MRSAGTSPILCAGLVMVLLAIVGMFDAKLRHLAAQSCYQASKERKQPGRSGFDNYVNRAPRHTLRKSFQRPAYESLGQRS